VTTNRFAIIQQETFLNSTTTSKKREKRFCKLQFPLLYMYVFKKHLR